MKVSKRDKHLKMAKIWKKSKIIVYGQSDMMDY